MADLAEKRVGDGAKLEEMAASAAPAAKEKEEVAAEQKERKDGLEGNGEMADPKAALAVVVNEKDRVHQENSLLSDHLMRLMMRSGSGDNTQIQLDSLEELDEVYDELEEYQADYPRGRTSSSRMSYNVGSPSSHGRRESSAYRRSWMRSAHEMAQGLSMQEKCDIAVLECKAIQDQMNIYRRESERILDELQAAYEEAELRTGEIRRDLSDFQREVMEDAKLRARKKAISEKVLKFLEGKIKDISFKVENLQERNATTLANIAKTEVSLEMKKELSDVLHAVDFDQLSIQKQQLENQLRKRDEELHRMKASNLKTISALEKAQAQLNLLTEEDTVLRATVAERAPQLLRVKDDIERGLEKKTKMEETLMQFIREHERQMGEKQPYVLEYMKLKKKVADLQQVAHVWQNKVKVAELTAKQLSIKLNPAHK